MIFFFPFEIDAGEVIVEYSPLSHDDVEILSVQLNGVEIDLTDAEEEAIRAKALEYAPADVADYQADRAEYQLEQGW